jgi:hypothetical protein
MIDILKETRFDFVSQTDKGFINGFDAEMKKLGYGFGGNIGSGYCWGRYMLIYRKEGVKSEKVFARIYIRETGLVLRLFLSDVDKHRTFVENAPAHIRDVFAGAAGNCQHCENKKGGLCAFRKTYTMENRLIEKCSGVVFEFHQPGMEKLPDYIELFSEFFPARKR